MNAKANNTIDKVRQLQRKLYLSAKKGRRRFHVLYDKVYREDILQEAWKRVRANKGAGGIDGQSIKDIEVYGVGRFLAETREMLIENRYKSPPVKRVFISKADGSKRALGIPTIRDRVVQMAAKIAIEPVFEADFKECSYGFRPKRNAKMALEEVRKAVNNKGYYVIDADIKLYFDNINHDKLMLLIEQRISDRRILKLMRNWLKAGILDADGWTETTIGSAQGSVISPLCANIYLNLLDTLWEKHGRQYGKLVRYAEDLVVICKKAMKKMKKAIKLVLGHRAILKLTMEELIKVMNPKIRGWRNYYGKRTAKKWLNSIDWYMIRRYTIWYNKKHQKRNHLRKIGVIRKMLYQRGLERLAV